MAAGLGLPADDLPEFRRRLARTVADMLSEVETEHTLPIDAWLGLPEITLELAQALECLAPFGPGNDKLVLAAAGLTLQASAAIGRNREHLKLTVADVDGNSRTVLWWNGAEDIETLPQGRFDLAFTLRASDWRGVKQPQMEFVDARSLASAEIAVSTRSVEVVDHRSDAQPLEILAELRQLPGLLVWAEGEEKKQVQARDRRELAPAEALAIWTIPASPQELHLVLETVQPKTVYLFAVTDPAGSAESFLTRLLGLLKYAINHKNGETSITELAIAASQRPATIQRGIEWLVARGKIIIRYHDSDTITISPKQEPQTLPPRQWPGQSCRTLLAETSAYRTYFKQADKDALFNPSVQDPEH